MNVFLIVFGIYNIYLGILFGPLLIKEAKAGFPPCVFVILGQERKDGLEKNCILGERQFFG